MARNVAFGAMDGFAVCQHLRAMNPNLPILMLSARGVVEDRVRGLNLGADDYLTKPFAEALIKFR